MKQFFLIIALFLPIASFAGSNFDEGVKAFQDSNYVLAIEKFQASLAETPNDIASYYNLGLAHTEAKQYGKAIWYFEKVLKLSPADVDAKDRIQVCYSQLNSGKAWQPRLNRFQAILYGFSGMTWSVMAIVFSFALALFTILFLRMKDISYRRLFVALGFLSFCCMVVSIVVAYGASKYSEQTRFAVVTKASIPTYKESNKIATSTLKEGDQLEILEAEITGKNFIQVSSQSGDTYLVKSTDIDFI